jgi:cytochrome c oxidase subunit 2
LRYIKCKGLKKDWSVITFGCWQIAPSEGWGNICSPRSADTVVKKALELGISAFDTAEGYGDGESERRLGKALGHKKEDVIIISKIWPDASLTYNDYQKRLNNSLTALKRDYVDVYLIHFPSDYFNSIEQSEKLCMIMEEIVNFHNYVMIYLTFILIATSWIMAETMRSYGKSKKIIAHKYLIHGTTIEIIWTVTPAIVLILIAFPSFKLIYLIDEVIDAGITIKVIGHQWYWSYEYSDYADQDGASIEFDSYMVPTSDLEEGDLRLLEVDSELVVPTNTHVRVILTSADVIHCWAVPSLGVKLDAMPGRLNQTGFLANREGVFYGQCSEICGANHAFMPIVVKAVSLDTYCNHIETLLSDAR